MEKDKLYNAARSEAFDLVDCAHQTDSHDLVEAFVQGAEWLQSQPLSERLTENDVDKLNNIMFLMRGMAASHQMSYDCLKHISNALYDVFGKEIFIERQSKYAVVNTAFLGKEMFENE